MDKKILSKETFIQKVVGLQLTDQLRKSHDTQKNVSYVCNVYVCIKNKILLLSVNGKHFKMPCSTKCILPYSDVLLYWRNDSVNY